MYAPGLQQGGDSPMAGRGIDRKVGLRYLRSGVDRSGGGTESWPYGASQWKKHS